MVFELRVGALPSHSSPWLALRYNTTLNTQLLTSTWRLGPKMWSIILFSMSQFASWLPLLETTRPSIVTLATLLNVNSMTIDTLSLFKLEKYDTFQSLCFAWFASLTSMASLTFRLNQPILPVKPSKSRPDSQPSTEIRDFTCPIYSELLLFQSDGDRQTSDHSPM